MTDHRIIGIDYLRAIFSACVVLIHIRYPSPSTIFNTEQYVNHTFTFSDFINFYLLLLAVPVFFITSNYLVSRKPAEWTPWPSYLKRLLKLAIFWPVLYAIFRYAGWRITEWFPRNLTEIFVFILSAGHTVYYFFISLIGLTMVTHFSKRLTTLWVTTLFIASTFVVGALPLLAIYHEWYFLAYYWNPLNFIAYPFAAILISRSSEFNLTSRRWTYLMIGLLLLFILSAILDWSTYIDFGFFNVNAFAIPAYTRPSLIFLAAIVLLLAIRIRLKSRFFILFMSRYSLALYCLHPFFTPVGYSFLSLGLLFALSATVLLSYAAAFVLSSFLKKELI